MASFTLFKSKILQIEGGYQSNPNDKGNYTSSGKLIGTNRGISAPRLEDWMGREPSIMDMKKLSKSTALKIYEKRYWDEHRLYEFDSQDLAEIVCDGIIQHGPGSRSKAGGITILQESLNVFSEELEEDGAIGPLTIEATNRQSELNGAALYNIYREKRIEYYHQIVNYDPNQLEFLNGWLNRMNRYYPEKEEGAIITSTHNPLGKTIELALAGKRNAWLIILAAFIIPTIIFWLLMKFEIIKPITQ